MPLKWKTTAPISTIVMVMENVKTGSASVIQDGLIMIAQ